MSCACSNWRARAASVDALFRGIPESCEDLARPLDPAATQLPTVEISASWKPFAEDVHNQLLVSGQSDVEDRIAIGLRIVGDARRHGAALDRELQRPLRQIGQPGDAGLAIAIGAHFVLRLALAQESVLDCKTDLGIKNRFACAVFHNDVS